MASTPSSARPEDDGSAAASNPAVAEPTITVQVLSPSVGVNRPLLFPSLAASTTVNQLKDKIRQSLPLRPADDHQRLIHRGRAIVRESDTLADIFGPDAIRTGEQQTIHLVIRDVRDSQSPTPNAPSAPPSLAAQVPVPAQAPARGPSPAASAPPTNPPRPQPQHPYGQAFGYQVPPGVPWRNTMPPTSNPFPQPRMPSPSPSHTPEQAAAFQHQHQNMTQWLNNIQREAMARALNQNQRTRAQMGMRGVGDNGNDNSGRASPAPGQTIYREHIGPNGHTYQVETVMRTVGPGQQSNGNIGSSIAPADVQNIIRSADFNRDAALANVLAASHHNRPLTQPGATIPTYPIPHSITGSGRGTPDPALNRLTTASGPGSSQTRQGPEVYILSSPEGPRALLFNNASSETYYTPRVRPSTSLPQLRQAAALSSAFHDAQNQIRARHHHHHHHPRPHVTPQPLAQIQAQGQPLHQQRLQPLQQQPQYPVPQQDPAQLGQAQGHGQNQAQEPDPAAFMAPLMHRGNPPMAALPPLLMQFWPHLWLLFRLALFVWFFTSPNASWSRWFTIIVIAVFIFVLSTGVLNGVPDHVWRPLGRHLENLIPLDPRRRQGINVPEQHNGQPRQEPDPTEMARRLVVQHQGQDNWVVSQVRRLERAGLLFLASIAPGVAERHIANLEAAARAERERREAETREAEAASAAAEAAQNNQNNESNDNQVENGGEETNASAVTDADQGHVQMPPQGNEGPLVEQGIRGDTQQNEQAREQLIPL
ncbi:hypothetical protein FGRMN_6075 [Fusarium graminum]|nr:hypothetical protein FGRMN_6075 [Fusarium graminum]